jgi:protein SCO1/2
VSRPLAFLLALLLAAPATAAGYGQDAVPGEGPAPELPDVGIDQRRGETVPLDLQFCDEDDRVITLRDCVRNKPTILVLAYYRCPNLCTGVLNSLTDAMQRLPFAVGREYNVVTVSFDPKERPALASLKRTSYLELFNRPVPPDGWHFLTAVRGDRKNVAELAKAVGFRYEYDARKKLYHHAGGIMVLSPEGKLSRYFYGIDYNHLDLRLALLEAGDGKIGSPVDQVLLRCFAFDHATGRYTFAVRRVLQAAGIATVAAIAVGMWFGFRRRPAPVPAEVPPAPATG